MSQLGFYNSKKIFCNYCSPQTSSKQQLCEQKWLVDENWPDWCAQSFNYASPVKFYCHSDNEICQNVQNMVVQKIMQTDAVQKKNVNKGTVRCLLLLVQGLQR